MKVSELIKELKKMPKDAEVYSADHDHDTKEVSSSIGQVELVEKGNVGEVYFFSQSEKDDYFDRMPKQWVTIRP